MKHGRLYHIAGAALLSCAVVGFLTGTERANDPPTSRAARPEAAAVTTAPGYLDLRTTRRGPNAVMYANAIATFEARVPSPDAEAPPPLDEERRARRAYDGAPPVIPHAVKQDRPPDCLGCHEHGVIIAGRRAPAMIHPRRESCNQCHAIGAP